jgi:hypothetical protein
VQAIVLVGVIVREIEPEPVIETATAPARATGPAATGPIVRIDPRASRARAREEIAPRPPTERVAVREQTAAAATPR